MLPTQTVSCLIMIGSPPYEIVFIVFSYEGDGLVALNFTLQCFSLFCKFFMTYFTLQCLHCFCSIFYSFYNY